MKKEALVKALESDVNDAKIEVARAKAFNMPYLERTLQDRLDDLVARLERAREPEKEEPK